MVRFSNEWLGGEDYVTHLCSTANEIVWSQSNGKLWVSDIGLQSPKMMASNAPISGLSAITQHTDTVISADESGTLKIWDIRTAKVQNSIKVGDEALTSLSVSNHDPYAAVGTAAQPDGRVLVFDLRKLQSTSPQPLVAYVDSHSDDVTDVQWYPSRPSLLATGSTDGIVNLFDTSVTSEDDAVVQAFNPGASVHRTGFVGPTYDALFALSHMETLQLFSLNSDETVDLGDIRDSWKCEYVAGYESDHFLAGSNSEQTLHLIPFVGGNTGSLIELDGGHGEEVVRCFDFIDKMVVTGGEDGRVRVWPLGGSNASMPMGEVDDSMYATNQESVGADDQKNHKLPKLERRGPDKVHKTQLKQKYKSRTLKKPY